MNSLEALFSCLRFPRLDRKTTVPKALLLLPAVIAGLLVVTPCTSLAQATTSTALTITPPGQTSSTVPSGTLVHLSATVSVGQSLAPAGRVIFCDNTLDGPCSDLHGKIGTAQLVTATGTATMNFFPGAGVHEYVAKFVGTNADASSISTVQSLTVTAAYPTQITLIASPAINQPGYFVSSTVTGSGGPDPITGSISLLDTNANVTLATMGPLFTFQATLDLTHVSSPATIGQEPTRVVVADFNGDGKPDLAVPTPGQPGQTENSGPLTILLGNGDGTFKAGPVPATATNPSIVAIADFNSDGKPDIALDGGPGGTLEILLGNGDGTFTASPSTPGITPLTITVGDFNGDGKPDLAVSSSNNNGLNPLTILLGNGDGTFTAAATPPQSNAAFSVAVGDFNGDGKEDLAVRNSISPNPETLTILLGNGDGTFTAQSNPPFSGGGSNTLFEAVLVGDFNGDGKADLVLSNAPSGLFAISILLGNGDGTFNTPLTFATTDVTYAFGIALANFNDTGSTDIAFVNDAEAGILTSNGTGYFTASAAKAPGATTGPDVDTLAIADFNGDGVPDIVQADSDNQFVTVYLTGRSVASGAAFNNVSPPGTGNHSIEAIYSGDASFATSTSSTVPIAAAKIVPTLALTSSTSSATYGAQVVLTAMLAPYNDALLTTNGDMVTFLLNGITPIGTGVLSSGVATLNITSLPAATDNVLATYAGDAYFASATSPAVLVAVSSLPQPAVTLSPTSLTFASQTIGTTSAAQMVKLTNSGTAPLTLTTIAASGDFAQTNNCGSSLAAAASCSITVTFTPTTTGARSGVVTLTDNASGSPQTLGLTGSASGLSLSSTSSSLNIATPGGSATTTLQIASVNGFSGAVNLTCAVAFPGKETPTDAPTCSVTPSQAQLAAATPVSATLTVTTTAASASAEHTRPWTNSGIALAALFFLGLLPRRRWRGAMLFSILGLAVLGGVIGCGGSNTPATSTPPPTTNPGTTTGSYQVTVTATSGSTTISSTVPLTLQ